MHTCMPLREQLEVSYPAWEDAMESSGRANQQQTGDSAICATYRSARVSRRHVGGAEKARKDIKRSARIGAACSPSASARIFIIFASPAISSLGARVKCGARRSLGAGLGRRQARAGDQTENKGESQAAAKSGMAKVSR